MDEICSHLKQDRMAGLGEFFYCDIDKTTLYKKCCPPKKFKRIFYTCLEDSSQCTKLNVKDIEKKL